MNVLVVDDEPIIRQVLRTMIDWENHGMKWAGEAVDGEEAWEAVQRGGIDLVITDILMPRMDGLELVKRLKQAESDVNVVVLSCLDDFAYVKEAMKQGASDYILKPAMEPDQLVVTLTEAKLNLQKRRDERRKQGELQAQLQQSKQAQRGLRLQKAWLSRQFDEELETELFAEDVPLSCWIVYVSPDAQTALAGWNWPSAAAYVSLNGQQQLLLFKDKEAAMDAYGLASELYAFLSGEGGLQQGSFFVTAVSPVETAEQLRNILQQHARLRHVYFYRSKGDGWLAAEGSCGAVTEAADGRLPQEEKQNLLRAITGRNAEGAAYWSEQLIERIKYLEPPVDQVYSFLYELLGLSAAFAGQHGEVVQTDEFERRYAAPDLVKAYLHIDSLGRWFTGAIRELTGLLTGWGAAIPASRNPFVRKAVEYMQMNYHLQISTSDISGYVKLSRSYLSDLYGKENGESLSESLTKIRIHAAKRMLEAGEMKVYEIAGAVGFSDAKAFAKTFKKVVGCTPKEYEEQNK